MTVRAKSGRTSCWKWNERVGPEGFGEGYRNDWKSTETDSHAVS